MTLKAIVVDLVPLETSKNEALSNLAEIENLVNTYGGIVVIMKIQKKGHPNYKTYIGTGKATEVLDDCRREGASLVIINGLLKARQLYTLGTIFEKDEIEIWDRFDLILKIFAKHASTSEAKLQIELASIKHMGPRIYRMGLDLSRQGGGIGTSGQGETNIEIMKRHLRKQEQVIQKKLAHYAKIKQGHRRQRKRQYFQTVAIVGYTNSGKSTLMNTLTHKKVYVADELFATLDSRVAQLYLPMSQQSVLLADTIGFIQKMPPELINAFKSTLAETIEADLLLVVIDISDPDRVEKIKVVEDILKDLDVQNKKRIYVFNKIDNIQKFPQKTLVRIYKKFEPIFVSAREKMNLEELKKLIDEKLDLI